jgi:hypothetical protein
MGQASVQRCDAIATDVAARPEALICLNVLAGSRPQNDIDVGIHSTLQVSEDVLQGVVMYTPKTWFAVAALVSLGAMQAAGATIISETGSVQYTNVEFAADVDAPAVIGDMGRGSAVGDFKLDEPGGPESGPVIFAGLDPFGASTAPTFSLGVNGGPYPYDFTKASGKLVTGLVMPGPTPARQQDITEASENSAAMPDPSTFALFAVVLAGLGFWRRHQLIDS